MSTPAEATRRSSGRRWLRIALWLAAVAVVLRLALAAAAVPIARALAARQGIALDVERLDVSLLEARVEAWRVSAAVQRGEGVEPAPLASIDSIALDLDALALLRGHVRVRRLELDGGRFELARDAAGAWNFAPLVERSPEDVAGEEPEPAEPYEPRPIVLEPPLEVVAARMQDLSLHLVDDASDPPLDATLTLSLSATDIGTPGLRSRLDLVATSPELLDLLRVRGSGTAAGAEAELDLDVELSDLRPRPLAHLVAPLGIQPVAARIDGGLALHVTAHPATDLGDRIALAVELGDLRLAQDGQEALALDSLRVAVPEAWPLGLHVSEVSIEGARLCAERLPDGATALSGIALRGKPAGTAAATPGEAAPAPAASEPFTWSVDALRVRGGVLAFADGSLVPALETAVHLEELTIGPLSSAADAVVAPFQLVATVPDDVERLELSGTFQAGTGALELALDAEGVGLRGIQPYLALAGIEPALGAGSLRVASLRLGRTADGEQTIAIDRFALSDGATELAAIDAFTLGPGPSGERQLTLEGARVEAKRDARGAVSVLGLRFGAAPEPPRRAAAGPAAPAPPPAATTGPEPAEFAVPELSLPNMRLGIERLTLLDATSDEPLVIGPVTAVVAPTDPSAPGARAYTVEVDGTVGLARELTARLQLEQAPSGELALAGSARARGLALEPLRPWLAPAGIEPVLADGAFDGEARATLAAVDGHPALDIELGPLQLTEGAEEHERLGLQRLSVERLVLGDGVAVDAVRIAGASLDVAREGDGGTRLLGLRFPPPHPRAEAPNVPASGAAVAGKPKAPTGTPAPALRVGHLELSGARVHLEDHARGSPETVHALDFGADVRVDGLAPGAGAPPTTLDARCTIGAMELAARGELVLDPDDLRAKLALSGSGLTGAPLAPWLPPDLDIALADGVLDATVDARVARAAEGGRSLSVHIANAQLGERGAERPIAALAAVRVDASRIDPDARVFAVEDLTIAGARLDVVHTADGGLSALGLHFAPPAEPTTTTAPPAESATPVPRADDEPAIGVAAVQPPRVLLDHLDLELAELRVTSEGHTAAPPSVSSARLALREPLAIDIDPTADLHDAPKIGLDLTASIVPGIGSLALALDLDPLAERPRGRATLAVRGIDGAGLLALAPELATDIDPAGLREGTLDATLSAELSWTRRSPFDFDLRGGFGAEIELRDLALRRAPEGPVEVGVDHIEALVQRVAPRSGLVHVSSIDIDTPRFHARRSPAGIEVAGIVLRTPPAGALADASPDAAAVPVADSSAPDDATPTGATAPAGGSTSELRVDSLFVHGVDARFDDVTVDPPFALPLSDLELDVRGFTTRGLVEPRPVRFSLFMGAGDVSLPERAESSSLLRGLATAGIGALAGKDEELRTEERPFFGDVTLTGRLTLAPPEGWIRCSTTGFELLGLRGLVRPSGIEIGDGVLDLAARVRLDERGGRVDSVSSFSHLSLSEPEGGPISRYLRLPAPLDTVLFALENEQGDHRIPLAFDFESGQIGTGQVAVAASKALLGLITEALASLPLRAAGSVTDVVGLGGLLGGGDEKPKYAGKKARIEFTPGGVDVGPEVPGKLEKIVKAMDKDELLELDVVHVFGPRDVERAESLASPASSEAARLLRALRQRRAELVRRRDELAATARVELLLGEQERFATSRREFLDVDRELGMTEDGVDRVAELLRPRAEERRERRTREAALAIARTRMDEVSRLLLDAGVPYSRITLRPPRVEVPTSPEAEETSGRVELVTRGGTPPKGWFRRMLGWIGL